MLKTHYITDIYWVTGNRLCVLHRMYFAQKLWTVLKLRKMRDAHEFKYTRIHIFEICPKGLAVVRCDICSGPIGSYRRQQSQTNNNKENQSGIMEDRKPIGIRIVVSIGILSFAVDSGCFHLFFVVVGCGKMHSQHQNINSNWNTQTKWKKKNLSNNQERMNTVPFKSCVFLCLTWSLICK